MRSARSAHWPATFLIDEITFDTDWMNDARRYYTNIVGKYGVQVQALLKKAASLDIEMICPLHGPIWRKDLGLLLEKYQKWSTYEPEDKTVMIAYATMYGNTENAANVLAGMLADKGVKNIAMYDVSETDVSELVAESFRCSHLVLAAPTYNSRHSAEDGGISVTISRRLTCRTARLPSLTTAPGPLLRASR